MLRGGAGDIPDPTVAVLTGDWNPHSSHASNSPNMMLDSTDFGLRHSAGALFSFVDGHVAMYKSPLPDLSVTGPQSVAKPTFNPRRHVPLAAKHNNHLWHPGRRYFLFHK